MGELNTVMEELIPEIRRVGEADTDVKVAVLTFSNSVMWMYSEPISIEDFEWTRLRADGVTSMGAAFKELSIRMSRSSFLNSPSLSFAPVIFLMTDGYPSDAEFTRTPDTVVHAYSGGQLAHLIKIIAVTSSQIGSKSMTLADDAGHELGMEDVYESKQRLLGQQIQEIVKSEGYSDSIPFDTGW